MQKYWLTLYPHTFIFKTTNACLAYNSLSGKSSKHTLNPVIEKIITEINQANNAYCVSITENELLQTELKCFVESLQKTHSGELKKQEICQTKPFAFKPKLRLVGNVDELREAKDRGVGQYIVQYLNEVTFYLNDSCQHNCNNCQEYYKQFSYCNQTKTNKATKIDTDKLSVFLKTIEVGGCMKVNFNGNAIFSDLNLLNLIKSTAKSRFKKVVRINYLNYPTNDIDIRDITAFSNLNILVHFPIKKDLLVSTIQRVSDYSTEWLFVISNEEEYEKAQHIIESYNLKAQIKPFYNKKNIKFFEEFVFSDEDDFGTLITKRDIFAKQNVNQPNFGQLTIFPDGTVFANVNAPKLGNIYNTKLGEILYNEMDKGTSWMRIRDMKPCCDCVYQWLCPSPSNYELAIGKPNLCHVKA